MLSWKNRTLGGDSRRSTLAQETLRMRYVLRLTLILIVVLFGAFDERVLTAQTLPQRLLDARKPNTTPSRFLSPVLQKDAPTVPGATLVLFVHGIFGDTINTWKHENGWSLARLTLSHAEFSKGVDAFAFGYPSEMLRQGSFSIRQLLRHC